MVRRLEKTAMVDEIFLACEYDVATLASIPTD